MYTVYMPYCIFCHKNINFRKVCLTCRSGFLKWVLTHTNIKKPLAVHKALSKVDFSFVELPRSTSRMWPGFYAGHGEWVKPSQFLVTDVSDEDITWLNGAEILLELLETRGIYINNDVQLMGKNDS